MTDVFFSYSSRDRDRVRPIRDALAAQGFDVFWDQTVPAGVDWDTWIRQHLSKAKCVVVVWTRSSVASDNVRHEATVAKSQGKLVPVLLEEMGAESFPMGLFSVQGANLSAWAGDIKAAEWRALQVEVEAKLTPLWVQRVLDEREAELMAERARVVQAGNRDRALQDRISHEAQAQHDLKQERDRAVEEIAVLRARLEEGAKARAELDARAVALSQRATDAAAEKDALAETVSKLTAASSVGSGADAAPHLVFKSATTSRGHVGWFDVIMLASMAGGAFWVEENDSPMPIKTGAAIFGVAALVLLASVLMRFAIRRKVRPTEEQTTRMPTGTPSSPKRSAPKPVDVAAPTVASQTAATGEEPKVVAESSRSPKVTVAATEKSPPPTMQDAVTQATEAARTLWSLAAMAKTKKK